MVTMEKEDSFAKYRIRKQLNYLRDKRSEDGSTCLVTLYIPEGRQISDFTQELTNEIGTAANIKSKTTKKNVIAALNITVGKLRLVGPKAPENGLALFTGVTETGKMESFVINPNSAISKKQYICDSFFHIDHLEEHLLEKKAYGLITMDSGYATIATLQGNRLKILKGMQSQVPKKHKAGGQSAARFGRIRLNKLVEFLKRVAETAKTLFIEDSNIEIEGLIIGGPGLMKNRLIEENYLDNRFKVLDILDIGMVSDKEGMAELVDKAQTVLAGTRYLEEKRLVQRFLSLIYKDDDKATYGETEIRKAIELGAVDLLLASEDINMTRVELTCQSTEEKIYKTIPTKNLKTFEANLSEEKLDFCSDTIQLSSTKDLIEDIGELALNTGAHVEIISPDTEEGQQLLHFGGLAALLRYNVNF